MDKRQHSTSIAPSLEELKKLIKQENLGTGRLATLRLPRDLSLGGTKPKKVYTPNLNVTRNKNKKHVPVKSERGRKRKDGILPNHTSHDTNNKRIKYVQSEGVFSQGIGDIKRNNHLEKKNNYLHDAPVAALTIPKINKNHGKVITVNEDSIVIDDLVVSKDESSSSESDTEYDPVMLPLKLNANNFTNVFKMNTKDVTVKIKKEPLEDITKNSPHFNGISTKLKVEMPKYDPEETVCFTEYTKGYDDDNPSFSILQLPTSFSGKVFRDDPNDKNLDYAVCDMPEGQLGKILVRKSGKMQMIIKNTKYLLNGKSSENLLENLMLFPGKQSIALEPSVVTLGSITEKFTLTPEWNSLFDRAKQENKFYW